MHDAIVSLHQFKVLCDNKFPTLHQAFTRLSTHLHYYPRTHSRYLGKISFFVTLFYPSYRDT
jgi:hypothetical protein